MPLPQLVPAPDAPAAAAAAPVPQASPRRRVLVAGWRGVSHSFAMVNQHQLLALQRSGRVELHHRDLPFFLPHWNARDTGAGFAPEAAAFIEALPPLEPALADVVYSICSPTPPPERLARRTLTFAVTEFGLSDRSFADPAVPLAAYTRDGNLVVTPSRWSRDRLLDRGFEEAGVRVVRHGVDPLACAPLSDAERALNRRTLGIADDAVVFLNVGLPSWNKGIDLLVAAFAAVHRECPQARLVLKDAKKLYGLGAEQVLKDLAARQPGLLTAEAVAAISVIGGNLSQAELRLLFGLADRYVSPYRAEGFNLPVLEALSCGTPVIVSSGGATDDFCHGAAVAKIPSVFRRGTLPDQPQACLVEPHAQSLQALMLEAARQGPLHAAGHALRQAAREATRGWSWDDAATELLRLL
jgi:glycosyltransferase involved in cell wall biosynthesis